MRARARALGILFVTLLSTGGLNAQSAPNEYRLKAAFVYQFPQFVDWPSAVWRESRTLRICVAQPNPFADELTRLARGESLNDRPLEVIAVSGHILSGCHVLFVGSGADAAAWLKAAAARPILTVGEGDSFLDEGGVIAFRIVDRRVRFEINVASARKGGLRISSQLLGLALAVRGGTS